MRKSLEVISELSDELDDDELDDPVEEPAPVVAPVDEEFAVSCFAVALVVFALCAGIIAFATLLAARAI